MLKQDGEIFIGPITDKVLCFTEAIVNSGLRIESVVSNIYKLKKANNLKPSINFQIKEINSNEDFLIDILAYPNPTNKIVNVYFSNLSKGFLKMQIMDIYGIIHHNVEIEIKSIDSELLYNIDFSQYKNGLYYIIKNNNGKINSIKILKE